MEENKKIPPKPKSFIWIWICMVFIILYLIIRDLDLNFKTLMWGFEDIFEYFGRYSAPNFSEWPLFLKLMIQTIATAIWGTFLALIIGIVSAPFASRSLTPSKTAYCISREFLNFLRSMPDLLLALIFVCSLGLGPLPGILALGMHTGGFLGKFFSESLDRVSSGKYEALKSVGAGFAQRTLYAGWPSIIREAVGYVFYIFDRNVRMSSVLGLVGAGGIGIELHDSLRLFNYNHAAALIIFIIVTIFLIDYLSTWLRAKIT